MHALIDKQFSQLSMNKQIDYKILFCSIGEVEIA